MDEQSNIVELVDEEGNTLEFEYLMTIDYVDNEYVILTPMEPFEDAEDNLEGDEVVILKVEQDDDGDDIYVSIDDEEELDNVFDAFCEIIAQNEE